WPHPMSVVRPGAEPLLLCDLEERVHLLQAAGADIVEVISFDRDLMAMSPEAFLDSYIKPLNPRRVVVGQNFRFGHRASGNVDTLRDWGAGRFEVTGLELLLTEHEETSSTEIRGLLADGRVAEAAQHLGRPFRFTGTVVVGHQRGREFGFPTANLPVPAGFAAPGAGVYAGWMRLAEPIDSPVWPAAISVGTNPTFDDVPAVVVEAHALDRDDLALYGRTIHVDFVDRLRGNVRFEGVPQLIEQIAADVERTRAVLGLDPES
ncbi:MAG: bifunctional riboflavin kinase/FMN adenylyltransferase, partial [Propionibacteriaceae bacterium]|nr:bifunctional riboflavin kinase/FMN adenylyltransferase [Propionibacteriaceae bacterium]